MSLGAAMCGIFTVILTLFGLGTSEAYPRADMRATGNFLLVLAMLGIVCFAIGAAIAFIQKPRLAVMVTSKSGKHTVLVSRKKDYIQTVVFAINDAILKSSRDSRYAGF